MVLSATNDSLASEQEKISLVWILSSSHVLRTKTTKSQANAKKVERVKASLTEKSGKNIQVETVPTRNERVKR